MTKKNVIPNLVICNVYRRQFFYILRLTFLLALFMMEFIYLVWYLMKH